AALASLALSGRFAVALGIGAAVQVLISLRALAARRSRIATLALDPKAYTIPEVDRFGRRCLRDRHRLALWLAEVVAHAGRPGSLYLGDRVARFRAELEALARALASRHARVTPASAVACRRLLT